MRRLNLVDICNSINKNRLQSKPLPKASKHLQKLSSRVLGSELHFNNLKITDNLARKTLKYKLAKKMKAMKFKTHVFAYYASSLRNNLQKLTLTRDTLEKYKARVDTKVLGSFKHLQKLTIFDKILWGYLKSARKLHNLRELSFTIVESNIPYVENLFRSLNKLHTVQVRILTYGELGNIIQKAKCRFLKSLTNLKNLKTLSLFIENCSPNTRESSVMFYQLMELLDINKSESMDRFELVLCMESYEESEPSEGAKRVLSKIEGLQISLWKGPPDGSTYVFERNSEINKKIKVFFSSAVNIGKLISECLNTKCLMILDDCGNSIITPDMKFFLPRLETFRVNIIHKDQVKALELLAYFSRSFAEEEGCQKLKNFKIVLNNLIVINIIFDDTVVSENYRASIASLYSFKS